MPIYEYRCQKCGHELEVMQKISDPAPDPCPKCGAAQGLERLVSRSSFQLKGGGWYSDLYGSTKKDSSSTGGSSSSSSASAPSTASSSSSGTPSNGTGSSSSGGSSGGGSSGGGSSGGGSSSGGSTP